MDSSCRPLRAVVSKQRLGRRREGERRSDDENHGPSTGPHQERERNRVSALLCPERGQPIRRCMAPQSRTPPGAVGAAVLQQRPQEADAYLIGHGRQLCEW